MVPPQQAMSSRIRRWNLSSLGTFDRAVLMRQAPMVAGRLHAVMCAQCLVAPRLILPCVGVEIAEGGRETVAAMLQSGPAERPQCVLQTLRQCHKAFPTEHDVSMLPP